jgi:hypothetical protein
MLIDTKPAPGTRDRDRKFAKLWMLISYNSRTLHAFRIRRYDAALHIVVTGKLPREFAAFNLPREFAAFKIFRENLRHFRNQKL